MRGNPFDDFGFEPKHRHPSETTREIQRDLAEHFSQRPRMKDLLEQLEQQPGRQSAAKHEILPDELFLGHSELDYSPENVIAPEFSFYTWEGGRRIFKPRNMLVLGPPGVGKSALMHIITFNNILRRNDVRVIVPDLAPNPEWHLVKYPITKMLRGEAVAKVTEYFSQFRDEVGQLKPEGFPGVVYAPAFQGQFKEKGIDKVLRFTLEDIREIKYFNPEQATNVLLTLTGLKSSYGASDQARKILDNEELKTFADVTRWADKTLADNGRLDSQKFIERLKGLLTNRFLSEGPRVDSLVDDLANNKFIAYRQIPNTTKEDTINTEKYQTGIKLFLTEPMNDRRRYVSGTKAERTISKIRTPIVFNLDEMSIFAPPAPQVSYTRDFFDATILYERKNSGMIVGATQFPSRVSEPILKSAEAIFVSGLSGDIKGSQYIVDDILDYVKSLGFRDQIDFLTSMEQRQMNSLGFLVNQWALLLPRIRRIFYFYPTSSVCGIHFTTA